MSDSVLTLAVAAADELSLDQPDTLFGDSVTNTGQKLLRHLVRTCRSLAGRYDWSKLRREHTFTTVATQAQTSATPIPTDFLRFIEGTVWNRSTTWAVEGPLPPDQWQAEQAANVTRTQSAFMIRNGLWLMTPTPAAGETIAYEYVTKYIGESSGASPLAMFTADTDTTYLDDELVTLGVVWRYRKAEGTDYSEEFREYEMRLYDVMKMDGGRSRFSLSGRETTVPTAPLVPDRLVFT